MASAARVASRVELCGIRLVELSFSMKKLVAQGAPLEPSFDVDCVPMPAEKGSINVGCGFNFKIRSAGEEVAESQIKYLIQYTLRGEDAPSDEDLVAFSAANGAYHAWPFVRETIYGLTSRMGFQPFVLPVLSFHIPKVKPAEPALAPESPGKKE